MVTALLCPRCGAPLATPVGGAVVLACGYCGAAAQLGGAPAPRLAGEPQPSAPTTAPPRREDTQRFGELGAVKKGADLIASLEEAARQALAAYGDQRAMVHVVAHLATDFQRETGVEVTSDPRVLARLADAYSLAAAEVAEKGDAELNLPFLAVSGSGPVHLQRRVTAAELARMTATPPPVERPAPPPPAPDERPPAKKKGWFW